jgi:hypothetical protein
MKDGLILTIANHMKKCFLNWNKDTVEDDVIFKHLFELSDGKIDLKDSEDDLRDANKLMKNNKRYSNTSSSSSSHTKKPNHKNTNRGRKRY